MKITSENNQQFISGIYIPPAPQILIDLQRELRKDEPELTVVASVLAQDVAISALVLRTVNSPYFSLRTKVNSIHHATSLLGLKNIANIVAGLTLRQEMQRAGANPPNFWDSPLNVALSMAYLAKRFGGISPDEAYMTGLFHNAGHSLLLQKHPDYNGFMERYYNHETDPITRFEEATYATDHATLGYYLAKSWGIEGDFAELIRDHHDISHIFADETTPETTPMCLLKVAEHLDKAFWGIQEDHEWRRYKHAIIDHLGLSETDYQDLKDDLKDLLISINN